MADAELLAVQTKFPQISKEQLVEFHDAFSLFDKDGNGKIEAEELQAVLNHISGNVHYKLEDVMKMIQLVDNNSDGEIDFVEFVGLMTRSYKSEREEIRDLFNVFDGDRDGVITAEEITVVLNGLGQTISTDEINLITRYVNIEDKGTISFEGFCKMMSYGPPKQYQPQD
eukprot:c900_g1_i1.p1 GENE.c900_g1_i1~~c900_g1_i1.p1  ORF type:complete len:184 (+),score=48.00 c900_g1_i1:45-554(+)